MRRRVVDETLEAAKAMGVRNILALRGDAPREHEYRLVGDDEDDPQEEDSNVEFTWAIDLVKYIRKAHGDYFCIGVAGYPEGHADESHPTQQDPKHDLSDLIGKTKAGADFIMTQLFYDLDAYLDYEKMLREHESGVFADIPIIPGLMPIQSFDILKRTTQLVHAKIPPELLKRLEGVKGDDEAVKQVGVDVVSEIVERIKQEKSSGPRGFHFYTLNLEKAVGYILERTQLIPPDTEDFDQKTGFNNDIPSLVLNGTSESSRASNLGQDGLNPSITRRLSSISSSPRSHLASSPSSLATVHGTGPLSREATWDDYPNGRFGDARSPAFTPTLSYSPSTLPVPSHVVPTLWSTPTTPAAITALFTAHLSGRDPTQLPWSESPSLSPETAIILPELLALNSGRNWWTIASQPAVDGLSSTHSVHGWGPAGGFVFQKAFVEFFLSASDWHEILRPHLESAPVRGQVSWYAGNSTGGFESSEDENAVHAVTWGMFPGREITTATMVEEVSFRSWTEEAFGIWAEWARCLGGGARGGGNGDENRGAAATGQTSNSNSSSSSSSSSSSNGPSEVSAARAFLKRCKEDYWLVNVIGHDFHDADKLWAILAQAVRSGEAAI